MAIKEFAGMYYAENLGPGHLVHDEDEHRGD